MSSSLKDQIAERIRREGPITFADFMQAALYDEQLGFYARHPVGIAGDYVTSPHISGAFGYLLAVALERMWFRLERPKRLDLVELAAGDGTLAKRILSCADIDIAYLGIDVSSGARASMEAAGLAAAAQIAGGGKSGCVLANELLDNVPFNRLRLRDGNVVEVRVGLQGDALVEIEDRPGDDALKELAGRSIDGERLVSPKARALVEAACGALTQGWVLLLDYDQTFGVRGFQGHAMHNDLYAEPGSSDITGGADFESIALSAASHGHRVHGPVTQRDFLQSLGFGEWYEQLRRARLESEERRETQTTMRLLAEQAAAPLLIDPAHLGKLSVMAIGVGIDDAPPGF